MSKITELFPGEMDEPIPDNLLQLHSPNAQNNPDYMFEDAMGKFKTAFIVGVGKDGQTYILNSANISQENILSLIESNAEHN